MIKEKVIAAVIGVLVTALWGACIWFIKRSYTRQKATEEGLRSLLRAEIIRTYEKSVDRGYCPIYSKEALNICHNAYKNLNGNSVADELFNTTMRLPTHKQQ